MNVLEPWNLVFVAGFLVYSSIRHVYQGKTRDLTRRERRMGTREKTLLIGVFFTNLLLPVLYLFTPLLSFSDTVLPVWSPWVGVVCMPLAVWLFWRSHADLGLNWSVTVELREEHQLVTRGVYRRIRHPMYAAIWLFTLAQGLLLANWLAGWGAMFGFAALYFGRVRAEEQLMIDTFGDRYREYVGRTGRLFPRFGPRG